MKLEEETLKELIIVDKIIESLISRIRIVNDEKSEFEEKRQSICKSYIEQKFNLRIGDIITRKSGPYKGREFFLENVRGNLLVTDDEQLKIDYIFLICRLIEGEERSNTQTVFRGKDGMGFKKKQNRKI